MKSQSLVHKNLKVYGSKKGNKNNLIHVLWFGTMFGVFENEPNAEALLKAERCFASGRKNAKVIRVSFGLTEMLLPRTTLRPRKYKRSLQSIFRQSLQH